MLPVTILGDRVIPKKVDFLATLPPLITGAITGDSKMKKTKLPKGPDFFLSEEALETHINFLKEKDPSIMGATCQMLSALMITLYPEEGLHYIIKIIDDMQRGNEWLSDDQKHDLYVNSIDIYLPKILKDKKWIYSINDYITRKLKNSLRTVARKTWKQEPLYFVDKEGVLTGNPKIPPVDDHKRIENFVEINEIFQKAGLTEREQKIYIFKNTTTFTEIVIAKILNATRDIVKADFAKAKDKLSRIVARSK